MQHRFSKNLEPKVHLYPIQMINEQVEQSGRWAHIKSKIKLNESLDEVQRKQLWELLVEFQGVFAWHKGELGHYYVGEHSIDTQGLPPCHMTLG
jgi:hypothetical protein